MDIGLKAVAYFLCHGKIMLADNLQLFPVTITVYNICTSETSRYFL
jgi:hypothetical protein